MKDHPSKKRRFLLYMADGRWHSNKELSDRFGWSVNQRKNELHRLGGIEFERKNEGSALWYYRLITPVSEIDFLKCRCKVRVEVGEQVFLF